jgi:hypothetical protein
MDTAVAGPVFSVQCPPKERGDLFSVTFRSSVSAVLRITLAAKQGVRASRRCVEREEEEGEREWSSEFAEERSSCEGAGPHFKPFAVRSNSEGCQQLTHTYTKKNNS